ncbi:tRNA (uracil-5-)-methyltransferase homolog A-like isoform X2 [Apostichopus japonicus]
MDTTGTVSMATENVEDKDQKSSNTSGLSVKDVDENSLDTDPYHYTKRGEFTSEIFKIAIQNLPRYYGYSEFKKLFHKLGLKPKKIKSISHSNLAFVTFNNEEGRQAALKTIKGYQWKKKILFAKEADPVVDPVTAKRKNEAEEPEEDPKKPKLSAEESVVNAVTPLAHLPYEEQLAMKETAMKDFLTFLTDKYQSNIPEMRKWLNEQRSANDGRCISLESIKRSPIVDGYRNKCEFSIGKSREGKEKIVGFRIGQYKGGHTAVASPLPCKNLSPGSKRVVEHMQAYLDQSELRYFDVVSHEGHWSQLTVRTTERSEVMAILQLHPQDLPKEDFEAEKQKLREYFTSGPGSSSGLTSLYLQLVGKSLKEKGFETNFYLVLGDTHVTEELLGLKFRISQDAFFQVNTKAAEVLFQTAGDWAEVTKDSVLLDVCCGTGTIGLSLAHRVKKVIGVELCKQAVEDAKVNAKNNGIENATYICGKAEDRLPSVMQDISDSEKVIGIIDPPRAGLHRRVIQTLRRCEGMKRLVYMSCNPYTAWNNFIDLCRPVSIRYRGTPFRLTKAVPVDLFPHSKHCELILLFQREDSISDSREDSISDSREDSISDSGKVPISDSREVPAATSEGSMDQSEEPVGNERPITGEDTVPTEQTAGNKTPAPLSEGQTAAAESQNQQDDKSVTPEVTEGTVDDVKEAEMKDEVDAE